MITRIGNGNDISGIIDLQRINLYDNLSPDERKQGFVSTPFSENNLVELMSERGVFVAEQQGEIAGYAMAGSWGYFSQWPIFPFMEERLVSLSLSNRIRDCSFQYGPVCINSALRGSGIFPLLFEEMRSEFASRFPIGVTFINRANERSYNAHSKLGMTVVDAFDFSGRSYYMLSFDTSRTVIDCKG